MYPTQHVKPISVDDAIELLAKGADGKFLAGGHTLIPTMKHRLAAPDILVDISQIESMNGIAVSDTMVRIGAATTHFQVASSRKLQTALPALSHLASLIGDRHVRNRGTIGGSLANNDPAADYPAAALGLKATIVTNQRSIVATDYFLGLFETTLKADELIVAIEFQRPSQASYHKLPNPASRYAVAGVMVSLWSDEQVLVAVTGAGNNGVFYWNEAAEALSKTFSAKVLAELQPNSANLQSDMHASDVYRAHMVSILTQRAVMEIEATTIVKSNTI